MSIAMVVDDSQLQRMLARASRLAFALEDRRELLEGLGQEGELQTRRRIADEKETPAGDPWEEWSEKYARTRHENHSLLVGEGHLRDTIQFLVVDDETVEWGSNLFYARTHQDGDPSRNITDREYLGISDDNAEDMNDIVADWLGDTVEEAFS